MKPAPLLLAALWLAAGCGQKGPLFLPGDPSQILTSPAEAPADDNADDDAEEQPDSSG